MSGQQVQDLMGAPAGSESAGTQTFPDRTVAPAKGGDDPAADGLSKNAAKRAAKREKQAAEKAEKSSGKGIGKFESKKATTKAPKKKIEGAALIGIDVAKEDDFAGWYQQVLLK